MQQRITVLNDEQVDSSPAVSLEFHWHVLLAVLVPS